MMPHASKTAAAPPPPARDGPLDSSAAGGRASPPPAVDAMPGTSSPAPSPEQPRAQADKFDHCTDASVRDTPPVPRPLDATSTATAEQVAGRRGGASTHGGGPPPHAQENGATGAPPLPGDTPPLPPNASLVGGEATVSLAGGPPPSGATTGHPRHETTCSGGGPLVRAMSAPEHLSLERQHHEGASSSAGGTYGAGSTPSSAPGDSTPFPPLLSQAGPPAATPPLPSSPAASSSHTPSSPPQVSPRPHPHHTHHYHHHTGHGDDTTTTFPSSSSSAGLDREHAPSPAPKAPLPSDAYPLGGGPGPSPAGSSGAPHHPHAASATQQHSYLVGGPGGPGPRRDPGAPSFVGVLEDGVDTATQSAGSPFTQSSSGGGGQFRGLRRTSPSFSSSASSAVTERTGAGTGPLRSESGISMGAAAPNSPSREEGGSIATAFGAATASSSAGEPYDPGMGSPHDPYHLHQQMHYLQRQAAAAAGPIAAAAAAAVVGGGPGARYGGGGGQEQWGGPYGPSPSLLSDGSPVGPESPRGSSGRDGLLPPKGGDGGFPGQQQQQHQYAFASQQLQHWQQHPAQDKYAPPVMSAGRAGGQHGQFPPTHPGYPPQQPFPVPYSPHGPAMHPTAAAAASVPRSFGAWHQQSQGGAGDLYPGEQYADSTAPGLPIPVAVGGGASKERPGMGPAPGDHTKQQQLPAAASYSASAAPEERVHAPAPRVRDLPSQVHPGTVDGLLPQGAHFTAATALGGGAAAAPSYQAQAPAPRSLLSYGHLGPALPYGSSPTQPHDSPLGLGPPLSPYDPAPPVGGGPRERFEGQQGGTRANGGRGGRDPQDDPYGPARAGGPDPQGQQQQPRQSQGPPSSAPPPQSRMPFAQVTSGPPSLADGSAPGMFRPGGTKGEPEPLLEGVGTEEPAPRGFAPTPRSPGGGSSGTGVTEAGGRATEGSSNGGQLSPPHTHPQLQLTPEQQQWQYQQAYQQQQQAAGAGDRNPMLKHPHEPFSAPGRHSSPGYAPEFGAAPAPQRRSASGPMPAVPGHRYDPGAQYSDLAVVPPFDHSLAWAQGQAAVARDMGPYPAPQYPQYPSPSRAPAPSLQSPYPLLPYSQQPGLERGLGGRGRPFPLGGAPGPRGGGTGLVGRHMDDLDRDFSSDRCHVCGRLGHIQRYCPAQECFNCHERGHYASVCPNGPASAPLGAYAPPLHTGGRFALAAGSGMSPLRSGSPASFGGPGPGGEGFPRSSAYYPAYPGHPAPASPHPAGGSAYGDGYGMGLQAAQRPGLQASPTGGSGSSTGLRGLSSGSSSSPFGGAEGGASPHAPGHYLPPPTASPHHDPRYYQPQQQQVSPYAAYAQQQQQREALQQHRLLPPQEAASFPRRQHPQQQLQLQSQQQQPGQASILHPHPFLPQHPGFSYEYGGEEAEGEDGLQDLLTARQQQQQASRSGGGSRPDSRRSDSIGSQLPSQYSRNSDWQQQFSQQEDLQAQLRASGAGLDALQGQLAALSHSHSTSSSLAQQQQRGSALLGLELSQLLLQPPTSARSSGGMLGDPRDALGAGLSGGSAVLGSGDTLGTYGAFAHGAGASDVHSHPGSQRHFTQ